jgi:hypothetical protein
VVVDGAHRDHEPVGDLAAARPAGGEQRDLALARRQVDGVGRRQQRRRACLLALRQPDGGARGGRAGAREPAGVTMRGGRGVRGREALGDLYGLSIGSVPLILVDAAGLLCGVVTLAITLSVRGSLIRPRSWRGCPERLS